MQICSFLLGQTVSIFFSLVIGDRCAISRPFVPFSMKCQCAGGQEPMTRNKGDCCRRKEECVSCSTCSKSLSPKLLHWSQIKDNKLLRYRYYRSRTAVITYNNNETGRRGEYHICTTVFYTGQWCTSVSYFGHTKFMANCITEVETVLAVQSRNAIADARQTLIKGNCQWMPFTQSIFAYYWQNCFFVSCWIASIIHRLRYIWNRDTVQSYASRASGCDCAVLLWLWNY